MIIPVNLLDDNNPTALRVKIHFGEDGKIWIESPNHVDAFQDGKVICIEYNDGDLKVQCWTDKNNEDPQENSFKDAERG